MPRAVVHCRTVQDVQSAIRAVSDCDLPLSVRGGGHDWAGRALCDGIVIDLSGMNSVVIDPAAHTARISGGSRASDVVEVADPLGLAPVTGSVGTVGVAGLTLGGGYGPLIGRFGLALDNLLAAEVVLADGRVALARDDSESELFWALRGGGGNFGVVTTMYHRLHNVPDVRSGMLLYPFAEAKGYVVGIINRHLHRSNENVNASAVARIRQMRGGKWVVLIAGSTGSALRAVCPFQPSRHAGCRRDLVYAASAIGSL